MHQTKRRDFFVTQFFNTGLTQQQFLEQYWQKKPLLIRQAFPAFHSPISPDELAGLACEPDIESRLIEEQGKNGQSWQVTHGPLNEDDFATLPETHWTILVQDVDKHLSELDDLLEPFRFIPDWRRDDLMISYAPKFGTVGPHTDAYDVFLLQAMGTRRWQIGATPLYEAKLQEGLDLQILAEFSPDQEWDLQLGDLLYLPPHFAHHGVALNECMTFSIGFRAPADTDLLDALVNTLLAKERVKGRYQDSDLLLSANKSEIDGLSVTRLKQLLHQTIDESESVLAEVLGKVTTETKSSLTTLAAEFVAALPIIEELNTTFEQGGVLLRNHYYRFAWSADKTGGQLFMAGESYKVDVAGVQYLTLFAEQKQLNQHHWRMIVQNKSATELLCQLIAEGGWYWQVDKCQ